LQRQKKLVISKIFNNKIISQNAILSFDLRIKHNILADPSVF
jgi:hypothetical protein